MSPARIAAAFAACASLAVLALLPVYADAYYLSLATGLLQFTVLATAWGLF
jgi:branched-chain amino acid transport system permease protein